MAARPRVMPPTTSCWERWDAPNARASEKMDRVIRRIMIWPNSTPRLNLRRGRTMPEPRSTAIR